MTSSIGDLYDVCKTKRSIRFSKNLIDLYFLGIQIMLPFCCHRGLSNGEKSLFTGFFKGVKSFPLYSRGGFGGYVVDNAVYALNLVYYAAGGGIENIIRYSRPVGGHKVAGHNSS